MSGHVGSGGSSVNSGRVAQIKKERLQFEQELRDKEFEPVRKATEKLARAQGQELAERRNLAILELRAKLTSQPSPEFSTEPYTGNDNPEEITRKITEAFNEWLKTGSPLPSLEDGRFIGDFIAANFQNADTTKASTFQSAYDFVMAAFAGIEKQFEAPVEAPVEVSADEFSSVRREIAELQERALKMPFGSRQRSAADHRVLVMETQLECLANPLWRSVCGAMSTEAQLVMPSDVQMKFFDWMQQGKQRRRYDLNTESGIRMGAAEFFGMPSLMHSEQSDEIQNRRSLESMSSSDLKRTFGYTNTGAAPTGTYRANRTS